MLAKVELDRLSISLLLSQISAAQDHFERTEGLMREADARDKQGIGRSSASRSA